MFTRIYSYLAAIAVAVASVAGIFFAGRKAGIDALNAKNRKIARKTERKATEALTTGLQHEQAYLAAARRRRALRKLERVRGDGERAAAPPTSTDSGD